MCDQQAETFVSIADMDEWNEFYTANEEAISDICDRETAFALACNCCLILGGGAAPIFRVGFVDGI